MQNRLTYHENIPDPASTSGFIGEQEEDDFFSRNLNDVFHEISDHLTKEELVLFAVYKNSTKRKRNQTYRVFLETHCKKKLSTSSITHKKKRLFDVLNHVGALLKFKRTRGIDAKLKQILTDRQFVLLMLYERRVRLSEIKKELKKRMCPEPQQQSENNSSNDLSTASHLFSRAVGRLRISKDIDIQRYLTLLGNVLRFSRTFPISKR